MWKEAHMRIRTVVLCSSAIVVALSGVAWAAAKPPDGAPIFTKYKCNSCHSIEAAGITKKAATAAAEESTSTTTKPPDLSSVGLEKKAEWIALFMQKKEKLDGKLHIKKFRGTDEELKTLSAWLETMKTEKAADKAKEAPAKETPGKEAPGGENSGK